MASRAVMLLLTLALVAAVPVVANGASTGPKGSYKGTAKQAKKTQKVGASIDARPCPSGKKSLCLIWNPGFSTALKCEIWNDADPTHKPSSEGRAINYFASGISAKGKIDFTTKKTGPGFKETLHLTGSATNGKLTGKVKYTVTGRSSIISKDCTGSSTFSLKRS